MPFIMELSTHLPPDLEKWKEIKQEMKELWVQWLLLVNTVSSQIRDLEGAIAALGALPQSLENNGYWVTTAFQSHRNGPYRHP